jgi:hypothetical protein
MGHKHGGGNVSARPLDGGCGDLDSASDDHDASCMVGDGTRMCETTAGERDCLYGSEYGALAANLGLGASRAGESRPAVDKLSGTRSPSSKPDVEYSLGAKLCCRRFWRSRMTSGFVSFCRWRMYRPARIVTTMETTMLMSSTMLGVREVARKRSWVRTVL